MSIKRPSQADVAKVAGVSRSTVSYVLNGVKSDHVLISEETCRRVWDAIDELGYVPDSQARALRSGTTHTLGMFIPDIRNPHFWEIAEGVELEAHDAGYHLLISNVTLRYEDSNDIFTDLLQRRTDGLVTVGWPTFTSEKVNTYLNRFLERRLPIVEICNYYDENVQMDRVSSDYHAATHEAMSYLLGLNHRRVGMLYGVALPELGMDRLVAYKASLNAAELPVEQDLIVGCGSTIEDGYQATLKLLALASRPTAIIAINDFLAIGALRAITDSGLRVPADISLVSFDDITIAQYTVPRLTTVSKDPLFAGRTAVKLLLARLQEPDRAYQTVKHSARLIIRESTGPVPF